MSPRRITFLLLQLFVASCAAPPPYDDPWSPGGLTLFVPEAREALAARLETAPWPVFGKARAVALLTDWVRQRGVRSPLPFFQRLAPELTIEARRALWLQVLAGYPGERPLPPREDPVAAWLLRDLAKLAKDDPSLRRELVRTMHGMIERLGTIADPRHQVRSAIADLLAELPHDALVADLYRHLLEPRTPGVVRARAMLSLGVGGFDDPALLPMLLDGLHRVQDHVNLAPFALASLSGTRGEARIILVALVERTLVLGRAPVEGLLLPPAAAPHWDALREALEEWESAPAALQDPTLMPRTFARLLAALGAEEALRRLLVERFNLAGRPPEFQPDETFHAVRELLLAGLPPSRGLPAEEAAGIGFGDELASRALAVARATRTCRPEVLELLLGARASAVVRLTTLDWIAQFRDAALKAALAKPDTARELTEAWNAQESEEGQWRGTARFWMPLVRVPGEGKKAVCDEEDAFEGMSPDEWLRARIERTLWICGAPGRETPVQPGPTTPIAEWERAWDAARESARAARSAACLRSRLDALAAWERRVLSGCAGFDCLWDRLAKEGVDWPEDAVEKAFSRLTSRLDGDVAGTLPQRLQRLPRELAVQALEWFEPRLSPVVRVAIRDAFRSETCLQDPACLPVLLHAVGLANRQEVRSEPIPTRE